MSQTPREPCALIAATLFHRNSKKDCPFDSYPKRLLSAPLYDSICMPAYGPMYLIFAFSFQYFRWTLDNNCPRLNCLVMNFAVYNIFKDFESCGQTRSVECRLSCLLLHYICSFSPYSESVRLRIGFRHGLRY
jgi:hypothetical protein